MSGRQELELINTLLVARGISDGTLFQIIERDTGPRYHRVLGVRDSAGNCSCGVLRKRGARGQQGNHARKKKRFDAQHTCLQVPRVLRRAEQMGSKRVIATKFHPALSISTQYRVMDEWCQPFLIIMVLAGTPGSPRLKNSFS